MKWLAGAAIALIFVIALAIAATPILISADRLEQATVAALEELTGREVTIVGETTIFPNLRLTVEGVRIAGDGPDDPPLLTAESLSGVFGLLPVVLGRFELSEVHFRKPRLRLARDAGGRENWRGRGRLEDIFARPDIAGGRSPVGRVTVEAGTVTFTEAGVERLRFRDVVGLIDWPSLEHRAHVSGSLRWRREVVDLDLEVDEPLDLIGGGASNLRLEVTSAPLRVGFSGTAAIQDTFQLDGEASATTGSLAGLAQALGLPAGPEIGPVSVRGALSWDNDQVSLPDAYVEVDGDAGQGALTVDLAPAPRLRGTLAFGTLDLAPSGTPVDVLDADAIEHGLAGLAPLLGGVVRTDLRLSATTLKYGPFQAAPAAATLASGEGGVVLSVGEAGFAGGTVQGEARVSRADGAGVFVRAVVAATDIDLARTFDRLGLAAPLAGTATGRFNGTARVGAIADLASAAAGELRAEIVSGSLRDYGLWDRIGDDGRLELSPDASTPFDTLSLSATFTPEHIRLAPVSAVHGDAGFEASLTVDPRNGGISGDIALSEGDPPVGPTYGVSGTLAGPVLTPAPATR